MSDDLSTVIENMETLRTGTIQAGIQFKGFTKSITKAADSTSDAGKAWTTFSRLVSGTPIWAMQNKFRAYLSILGGFETRSNANAKAMTDETKKMLQKIKGYEKLNKQMTSVADNERILIKHGVDRNKIKDKNKELTKSLALLIPLQAKNSKQQKDAKLKEKLGIISKKKYKKIMADLTEEYSKNNIAINKTKQNMDDLTAAIADVNEETMAAITNTEHYHQVLQGGGGEEKAILRSIRFYKERNEEVEREQFLLKKTAKFAYAYDDNRIKDAKELSKIKSAEKGFKKGGFLGKFKMDKTSRLARKAGKEEKKAMTSDQTKAGKAVKNDLKRANAKGVTDNLKTAKMLLFPLWMAARSAKFVKMALKPMSADAKKFRAKMRMQMMNLQPILSMAFKYLVMGLLAIAGFFLVLVFLKRYYKILQGFGVIDDIKDLGRQVIDLGKLAWGMISAFLSGDYKKALDYASKFVDKGIDFLISAAKVIAEMAWFAIVAAMDALMDAVYKFYKDPAFRKQVMGILLKVALVVVALIVIQFLIGVALSIAAMFALPILLGVVILAALYTVAYWVDKKFGDYYQKVEDSIANVFHSIRTVFNDAKNLVIYLKDSLLYELGEFKKAVVNWFTGWFKADKAKDWIKDKAYAMYDMLVTIKDVLSAKGIRNFVSNTYNKIKGSLEKDGVGQTIASGASVAEMTMAERSMYNQLQGIGTISKFAKGGVSSGGMALVGEEGPELVNLSGGSKVFTNSASKKMMGSVTNNFNITVNAKDTSDAEMRRMAEQLGKMIGNKMNRMTSARGLM